MAALSDYYKGKRVFLTGHTGFKGAYLSRILQLFGAEVTGYSLDPPTDPSLFDLAGIGQGMTDIRGDVRDAEKLDKAVKAARPEIIFHLAAQPLVRLSYREPRLTFETNIMGTVNLMESVRTTEGIRSVVNVTTDKVYLNEEGRNAFKEDDPLGGYDPYSNSKSCSDLVTQSYRNSFFNGKRPVISTVRAGNVIGGCDFAEDRLIPDCVRAAEGKKEIIIRNPASVRPFQHVLEPLCAYLMLAESQDEDPSLGGAYNVGPDREDCLCAGDMATIFCREWNALTGGDLTWKNLSDGGPHEAGFLMLDNEKIKEKILWHSIWNVTEGIKRTAEMEEVRLKGGSVAEILDSQIKSYFGI